jgi:hypothetical protein
LHWNVNGKAINSELKPQFGAVLENNHGILFSKAIGASFRILCTGVTFEEAVLKVEGGSLGKIRAAGCKILLNEVVSVPYEPHTGTEKGVILSKLLKGLIVLHEGEPVYSLEPEVPPIIFLVETGPECSVGSSIIIIGGKITLKDCQKEGRVEKVTHLLEELAALTELWIISKTAEHKATVAGSLEVFLLGGHAGLTWGSTPA